MHFPQDHHKMAQSLLKETRANSGLALLDVEGFCVDEEITCRDNSDFSNPQMFFGIPASYELSFAELDIEEEIWRWWIHDEDRRLELQKAYNEKAEKIIERRFLSGRLSDPNRPHYLPPKALHDIFEVHGEWHAGSWRYQQSALDEAELSAFPGCAEKRAGNLRVFLIPESRNTARSELVAQGIKSSLCPSERDPVTFADSIVGVENLVPFIIINPHLAHFLEG